MRHSVVDYLNIVGEEVIVSIYKLAGKLYNRSMVHINSTYYGGGVAEMLSSLIPLLNDVGISAGWRILKGSPDFFEITKKFHNALQGDPINLTDNKKRLYLQTNEDFSTYTHIDHDIVIIHDPQPLPLIKFYHKKEPWIWRCHVDLSNPNPDLWNFLKRFIIRYEKVIVSSEQYKKPDLPVEQRIFFPVIDPLSPKNREISQSIIDSHLRKFKIPTDKPILLQISRFDKWKDPLGVLDIYERVRQEVDCRLILCGSMATDDPEGWQIYQKVMNRAKNYIDNRDVILITVENHMLVNVLQRAAAVVIQKSLKEGFGLTVTEALWKEKPVVASRVGGIPLQITDGQTGFLVEPTDHETFARRIVELIKNPDMGRELGRKGKEVVREKFLITRLIIDYLNLMDEMLNSCGG